MLIELRIENFAIIERLELSLSSGLITFTGETGAGKSIIIDAVEMVLGGSADPIQIRSGMDRAIIEAVFTIPVSSYETIRGILEREDLVEDQDYLTITREVRRNGRSVSRLNGRSINLNLLKEISQHLVDIHGQSDHLSLLRVDQHIHLLDRYASLLPESQFKADMDAYSQAYWRLKEVQSALGEIRKASRDSARQIDMLTFQINEIDTAHLQIDEEELLRTERNRLANAENLTRLVQAALVSLDDGSSEAPAASDLIGSVVHDITEIARLDPSLSAMGETSQILFDNLNELIRDLRQYLDTIEFNSKRLDQLEERLALIQLLKRKYGDSISSILSYAENARRQLDQITNSEERIDELEIEESILLQKLGDVGEKLSTTRKAAATLMGKLVETELIDLHMDGARFRVDFQQDPDDHGAMLSDGRKLAFSATGIDKVEFLIAPNPGEGFKPLARIASGGETSRLMLALKNVLAKADRVPTLIFDEIDQGIGGRVGAVVGRKLKQLGSEHQVLCITHLPQLAAYGNLHLHVEKQIQGERTLTSVRKLEGGDRIQELAQMLGGVSESTLKSAEELLVNAQTHL